MPEYRAKVAYGLEERRIWTALPFPRAEYERRIREVQAKLRAERLDALVAFSNRGDPGHVRYLSNFEAGPGDTVVVVPVDGAPMLSTNWLMHGEPMHTSIWATWLDDARPAERPGMAKTLATSVSGHTADRLQEARADRGRVALAGTPILPYRFVDDLRERLPRVTWVAGDDLLFEVRAKKSAPEIDAMRAAARMSGRMHAAALAALTPGASERDVAAAAHAAAFADGADALAFDSAVATGPRAGLKHCAPTDRIIQTGDMVFLDMAAMYKGYFADVSRSTVVGDPSDEQRRFLEAGLSMFEAALAQAGPGVPVHDLIVAARVIAEREGYEADYMPKGFGHGLGCSLFELPSLRPTTESILEPGNTFALEPMLVRTHFGTACIEETVLITEQGAEALSGCPLRVW